MTAAEIVDRLALEPHPEGGFFRQTWMQAAAEGKHKSQDLPQELLFPPSSFPRSMA